MKRAMKHIVIREQLSTYIKASRKEKGKIIEHITAITDMPRKSIIRSLSRERKRSGLSPPSKLGRPKEYIGEVDAAIAYLWEAMDNPCGERMKPLIAEYVRILKRDKMWDYDDQTTSLVFEMSLGTLKRKTTALGHKYGLMRGISTTRSGELLQSVPIFHGDWKDKAAGHGQIDTVVHSGPKLMGTMAYTTNYIDVPTYWQEPVAQLGKGEKATINSMKTIKSRLPFAWKEAHPDSGSEFINWNAKAWFESQNIELTRSRPHKSNDNCYIEQRNLVVVRKYIGYERYDCLEAIDAMNEYYKVLRLYLNFFQPTFKLQEKKKILVKTIFDGEPQITKKWKKSYDVHTPYQRVITRKDVPLANKVNLAKQYENLNPITLRVKLKTLKAKLERIQKEQGYHY